MYKSWCYLSLKLLASLSIWALIFSSTLSTYAVQPIVLQGTPTAPALDQVSSSVFANSKNVLLLYDRRNIYGYKNDEVTSIRELFGHFTTTVTEMPYKAYHAGDLNRYDRIVLIGLESTMADQPALVSDLKNTSIKTLLIGEPFKLINTLYDHPTMVIGKKDFNAINIQYKNINKVIRYNRFVYTLQSVDPHVAQTTLIGDGTRTTPYIMTYKHLTLVTSVDTNDLLYFAFADSLHEFFDENHDSTRRAYLRIEDVHALRDYDQLKKIADYLSAQNFPFIVVLIPAYMNTSNGKINTLTDYPDFVKTLKYMADRGGSFLLHGYTHQTQLKETGEGYEFWDGPNNRPMPGIENVIHEKLDLGLLECLKNGIQPLAFEAPHYAISQEGYKTLKQYFSTYVGQLQTSDNGFTTISIPYEIHNTDLVNHLLPENLGYVAENDPTALQQIDQNLDDLDFVRDYTAGVFFHPYLKLEELKKIVELLKAHDDFSLIDLKHEANWVSFQHYQIVSNAKGIQSNYTPPTKKNDIRTNTYTGSIILAGVVAFFCLIFLIIFIISRRRILRRTFK